MRALALSLCVLHEAAGGHPTAAQLQHDYLDRGSPGLKHLAGARNVTGARIAEAIEKRPARASGAPGSC
jgi:hypothetical protein